VGKTVGSSFGDHYDRLLVVARARLAREQVPISTITLAHELYLSLQSRDDLRFDSMEQFLAYASRAMRSLLVDMARERLAAKRSAQLLPLTLGEEVCDAGGGTPEGFLALNQAIERLGQADPRLMRIAEMRAVAGMEVSDIATALGVSEPTVKRDWRRVRAFLVDQLGEP
jgi:RNA polymerase sigma factor (TIGR02999 family)